MRACRVAFVLCLCAGVAGAQTPSPAPGAAPLLPADAAAVKAPDAAAVKAPEAVAAPEETYTYDPGGRRDPFVNLLGIGGEQGAAPKRGEGSSGLSVSEISVRGIMQSRGTLLAMVQGPDNKTYVVHQGDKLVDGTVKTVTPQGLVIMQDVNDPLSLVKQREIRKLLRSLEDAKQ